MMRRIPLLLIVTVASCMEMRETVERMVMVRTTGSDLQPAATGYIYKKQNDGLASVIKMDEDEILEQLSKFYDHPKVFAAHDKEAASEGEADDSKEESRKEAHVIPVVEKHEENAGHIDGIADDEYPKNYDSYEDYKNNFEKYLHGLKHYKDGLYQGYGEGDSYGANGHHAYGDKGYKGYGTENYYGKGGAGDYHNKNYKSFYATGKGGHGKDYDEANKYGKHYAEGHGEKGGDHGHKEGHSKGEKVEGFHKVFDKDEFKKDHDFYDGEGHKGDFNKFSKGYEHHETNDGGNKKGESHDSGHTESGSGKEGHFDKESGADHDAGHSAETGGKSEQHGDEANGAKGDAVKGQSYGYEVKH
ncbi:hypothetical protein RR48_07356 [Papilio machaon]|uniref:Uncharacterized protein n=1 Tax=Papilio machaon TaxID=76193 RepID=A0A194RKL1_PAPMA|nr:hypothetical protein RR48_07356 [Papilio machaon]